MSERPEARVVPPEEHAYQPVARARGARMAVLIGPDDGAPNFVTRRFVLEPGGRIPGHRHPSIEHEQVVLRGEMTIGLDQTTRHVSPGDAIFIPAGVAHWYENRGDEPVEFVCIVPRTVDYATEWLEDPPEGAYLPG
jgi:quercetin dioxygenase-like cupin family protein